MTVRHDQTIRIISVRRRRDHEIGLYLDRALGATAEELDALHDAGGDLEPFMDTAQARRPGREVQRVNVDFPLDLLAAIDREARRIGVARQAFIKMRRDSRDYRTGHSP